MSIVSDYKWARKYLKLSATFKVLWRKYALQEPIRLSDRV